jgi:hypothetical protein
VLNDKKEIIFAVEPPDILAAECGEGYSNRVFEELRKKEKVTG